MKILLVEDSLRLQRSMSAGLRGTGHAVDQAFDGQEALDYVHRYKYEVVVLDLMIPKIDGLKVLMTLRQEKNNVSVLILSAKDQTKDRIRGLDFGADDYLVKPFSFEELVSRIRALSRRSCKSKNAKLEIDTVLINSVSREVSCSGTTLQLTPSEFALLEYLARRRGQVFSHQQLIDRLYESTANVGKNAVEAHISALRKKLTASGSPQLVKTRRGFGYLIEN